MQLSEDRAGKSWSLTTRAFIGISLIVCAVIGAIVASFAVTARRSAAEAARRNLEQSADFVSLSLAGRLKTLIGGARVFVQNPSFFSLMASQHREDVLDRAIEAADQINADWALITDAAGVLIAKSDEAGVPEVAMGRVPLVAGALRGQIQTGFGASGDTMLFQAVALPIMAKRGAPAGVLVATLVVDSVFLHDMKSRTSSEIVFFTRDTKGRDHPAASTLHASARDLTAFLASRADTVQNKNSEVQLGDVRYLSLGTSLTTAGGEEVGGYVVLRAREDGIATLSALATPLKIALVTGILVTLIATAIVSRFVTVPTRALTDAVSRASRGDLRTVVNTSNSSSTTQELQELSTAFGALVNDHRDKEALIAIGRIELPQSAPAETSRTPRGIRAVGSGITRLPLARQINNPGLVLEPGSVLANRYVIHAEVGRGGLGIVYRALDRVVGETIAIKVLRPELILADASAFDQLKIELRIARRLSHRNIVRTHDIGEAEDVPFLTMEYVDGASLATIIQARGALSRPAVLAMAKQLLGALAVAHDHGVVHGDLKPQNLLIDANGLLKVTDFGVARLVRARGNRSRVESGDEPSTAMRLTGAVVGTPEYMAPEQLIGEPSNQQTDLYAAGVVLKECLTGNTSYQADTPVAFVARKLGTESSAATENDATNQSASTLSMTADIRIIVDSLMHLRPELRPTSARAALSRFTMLT